MIKGWASIDALERRLTRQHVLDACDLLDALEDAEAAAHDAATAARTAPGSRRR